MHRRASLVIFEGAEILSMSADSRTKNLKSNETQLVMSKLNTNDRQWKSGPFGAVHSMKWGKGDEQMTLRDG
jgi:hypothetical protein